MSYADRVFIDMCRDIMENGTSTEGEKVRPVWEDVIPSPVSFSFKSFSYTLLICLIRNPMGCPRLSIAKPPCRIPPAQCSQ